MAKGRDLSSLSDEELEAERKRRRAANRPKKYRMYEIDEDTFRSLIGAGADDVTDDDEDGDDEDEDEEPEGDAKGRKGYFR